ncbi:hypothetical protein ACWDR1_01325 [Streptosporangium sandarakinum]
MTPSNRPSWPMPLLALTGWLALLVTHVADPSFLRVTVTIVFMLTCPGAAVLALARPLFGRRDHAGDATESTALALALSVAIGMIVSEAFFMSGTFTTDRAMIALASITTVAALGALLTGRLARRSRRDARRRAVAGSTDPS